MNAIDKVKASKRKTKAQRDNWKNRAVKAELLLSRIVAHYDIEERHKKRLHAPGHMHSSIGLWDKDGSACEWCATWSEVVYLVEGMTTA